MQTVSAATMIQLVRENVKGTSMVTVDLDSPMDGKGKMRKTGNPFVGKGIVKRETLNGAIGYNYGAGLNRMADKEGKEHRDAKPHPWGDMDSQRLFRIHRKNGKHYLSMRVQSTTVHGFFAPDGTEIPADEIRPFIPKKQKSSSQADFEGEIIARDYGVENITGLRIQGNEYRIAEQVQEQEREAATVDEPAPVS